MLVTGTACGLGYTGSTLANHWKAAIGGSFEVTAMNARTIGEFTAHCQIAVPGGSASCGGVRSFTVRCEDVHLLARPVGREMDATLNLTVEAAILELALGVTVSRATATLHLLP